MKKVTKPKKIEECDGEVPVSTREGMYNVYDKPSGVLIGYVWKSPVVRYPFVWSSTYRDPLLKCRQYRGGNKVTVYWTCDPVDAIQLIADGIMEPVNAAR